jgi:hypothetical protein
MILQRAESAKHARTMLSSRPPAVVMQIQCANCARPAQARSITPLGALMLRMQVAPHAQRVALTSTSQVRAQVSLTLSVQIAPRLVQPTVSKLQTVQRMLTCNAKPAKCAQLTSMWSVFALAQPTRYVPNTALSAKLANT